MEAARLALFERVCSKTRGKGPFAFQITLEKQATQATSSIAKSGPNKNRN